jgi:beta-galactosidase/beta-glucuronidase
VPDRTSPRAAYPRPQLQRAQWQDLGGPWGFAHDDDDVGRRDGWSRGDGPFAATIQVPYPPESALSGVHDPAGHPVVWYRRVVRIDPVGADRRVLLHLGAVDYRAEVWVNGQLVARHEGGHTPVDADITEALDEGGDQVVVVRAEDPVDDPAQPRGKQDWRPTPHDIWYHRTTGIWQPVWWEVVGDRHLTRLDWTPDLLRGRVTLDAELSGMPAEGSRLEVRLSRADRVVAEASVRVGATHAVGILDLPEARHGQDLGDLLWTPEQPNLLDARVALVAPDGTVLDEVTSYLGYRSVGTGDGRFLLNGRPYYLRLVLEQGYWPQSHLAAPDDDALRAEVEAVKSLGFNGIRIHQKIEDPRLLAWCDRLGLLVWAEMPSAYAFSPTAVRRVVQEWTEAVRRDRSHPCIVTWVPLNESWGVPAIAQDAAQRDYATALYHLTKALDPTRPVISNDGWEHTRSDILGVHDYAARGELLAERYRDAEAIDRAVGDQGPGGRRVLLDGARDRGRPVVLSEFGGLSLAPEEGEEWFGYATVRSAEEYLERFAGLVDALLDNPEIAGFCYTQLTDTEQERNGLLAADRTPKLDPDRIRAIVGRPARAVPSEEVDAGRAATLRTWASGARPPGRPNVSS